MMNCIKEGLEKVYAVSGLLQYHIRTDRVDETISFNGTRLRGWKYKSFQIHQNCICRDESNVVALQELLYLGLMTANDTQQYSLTEDGIQLLSWVTEVEIYE